jgi:hypothetical protein
MKKYHVSTPYEYEAVCTALMLVIGPCTLSALIRHLYQKRTLAHWRLILATAVISTQYILQMVWLANYRYGHRNNNYVWNENLKFYLFYYIWPLGTIPTLFYTWQFYDMVEGAANPKGKRPGFWPRAAFVAVATLGTLLATGLRGYYNAL